MFTRIIKDKYFGARFYLEDKKEDVMILRNVFHKLTPIEQMLVLDEVRAWCDLEQAHLIYQNIHSPEAKYKI